MRGPKDWIVCGMVGVLALCAGSRARADVSYTEGADLSNAGATPLGTLGIDNQIQGGIAPTAGPLNLPPQGDTADGFSVVVPAGYRLTSINVQIYVYSSSVGTPARFRCTTSGAAVGTWNVTGFGQSSNLVTASNGLAAGTYSFVVESLLAPSFGATSAQVGYIITMHTMNCLTPPTPTAASQDCGIQVTIPAGSPATEVWRSSDIGFGTMIGTIPAGQTAYFDPQTPGTAFNYRTRVSAANSLCGVDTSWSNAVFAASNPPSTPAVPANPRDNGCMLQWDSANGATEMEATLMNASSASVIYTATFPVAGNSYSMPGSFNPWPLVQSDHRVFWYIRTRKVCGEFSSGWSETFTSDFTLLGAQAQPTLTLVNGPCSVLVFTRVSPGASNVTVTRTGTGPTGLPAIWTNPATPYFEDTSAAPGNTYTYSVSVQGCNVAQVFSSITVARSPTSATRDPVRATEGQFATLSAGSLPAEAAAALGITWKRGGSSASDPAAVLVHDGDGGGRVSGATTPVLSIAGMRAEDTDAYWCTIAYPCGPVTMSVNLFMAEGCRADFDRSGRLEVADIFSFLNAWFAGCP